MLKLLAPVENIRFDLEDALDKQSYSVLPLPFNGMDKSAAAVCERFVRMSCDKEGLCPYRHVRGDKSVVCKHWLRGLCKKGDECEFLHEYDMSKMPECYFFSKYNQCGNKECEFLHIDRESKIKDCPWYDRGFCRHGPNCKNRHLKKVICQNYLFGFCPEGPNCKFKHPKFELPVTDSNPTQKKQIFICDYCGEKGHKVTSCFKLNPEHRIQYQLKKEAALLHEMNISFNVSDTSHMTADTSMKSVNNEDESKENGQRPQHQTQMPYQPQHSMPSQPRPYFHHGGNYHGGFHQQHHHNHHYGDPNQPQQPRFHQSLADVTCFKCGEKGHYANRCNKSVYSFLRGGGPGGMIGQQQPHNNNEGNGGMM